jgi:MFS family permease
LTLSIAVIAVATAGYSMGIAAPITLALLRMVQGLALGGEYCVAVIYISELAPVARRGFFVGIMMTSVNIGLVIATVFVMILNTALDKSEWRISSHASHHILSSAARGCHQLRGSLANSWHVSFIIRLALSYCWHSSHPFMQAASSLHAH